MWSQKHWAFVLTYYWGLVLSVQALISPVLTGPDFPNYQFLGFWSIHLLVVWAAIYLTWGRGMRPDWRSYRFAVAVTVAWVAVTVTFNSVAGFELRLPQRQARHPVIAGRDGAVAVVRAGGGGAGGCGVGGDDVAVGTDAPISDRRRRARVVGVLVGQLSDAHTVDEPVQYATAQPGATGLAGHGWTQQQAETFAAQCRTAGFGDVAIDRHGDGRRSVWAVSAIRS